jgi:uncharacterized protein YPO0396
MTMTPELIADGLLAALLIAAIAAALRLDARMRTMRRGQEDMARTAAELNAAATRAEAAIRGLRVTATECGGDLDHQLKRARAVADELSLLAERAPRTAQRAAEPQPAFRALAGAR